MMSEHVLLDRVPIMLSDIDPRGSHMTEKQIVKYALRGHAAEYERRAQEHSDRGYTAAGLMYMREALVLREVLKREFGDE